MNKWIYPLLLTCIISSFSFLDAFDGTLQVRGAAFFPLSHKFRQVYQTVAPDFQVEAGMSIDGTLEAWTNFDWMTKEKSGGQCCHSTVEISNASGGIKLIVLDNDTYQGYVGVGPSFGKVILRNKTCCEHENLSKTAWGVVFKSGIRYGLSEGLFLDFFADYLYQPAKFHHTVDVGGVKTGLGLGFGF